jgi:hypothetical protein
MIRRGEVHLAGSTLRIPARRRIRLNAAPGYSISRKSTLADNARWMNFAPKIYFARNLPCWLQRAATIISIHVFHRSVD